MPISSPTEISGLSFWGDAAHVTGNPVSAVDNRETDANQDLAQSTVADRPDISTTFGIDGMVFDGAANPEHIAGGDDVLVNGTLVIVMKLPTADGGSKVMWHGEQDAGNLAPAIWQDASDILFKVGQGNLNQNINTSPDGSWNWGQDVVVTITWNSTSKAMTLRIFGVQKASGTAALLGATLGQTLGSRGNDTAGANVTIYGLVLYDSILTGSDLTDIEAFMTATYFPVNVRTAVPGEDVTVTADEGDLATVVLDGTDSFSPLTITNYKWTEGAVVLGDGPSPILITQLSVASHTITLEVTDASGVNSNDIAITVNAFSPASAPSIRTFKEITSSTATVHTFSDVFPLTPRLTALPYTELFNQLRVFKKVTAGTVTELFPVGREDDDGDSDFTINTAGTQITLDVALITSDILVIMRDTSMFHPFVTFVGSSRFRGRDRNVQGDQVLFVVQELREIRAIADILGSDSGDPFEFSPELLNVSNWQQTFVGDAAQTDFSYEDIEMLPLTAVSHNEQLLVFLDGSLRTIVTHYTVDEADLTVNFVSAPASSAVVEIRRVTRIDQRWVTFRDGSTFSSLQDKWDFLNVKFIIEETQDFPTFIIPNALSNRIFPRALNVLRYSGPGSRFFFGNLSWFGDGTVFIFKNDLRLVELVDYTIDFTFFNINLTTPLVLADSLDIFTTTPNNAFGRLPLGVGSIGTGDIGESSDPDEGSVEPESVEASEIKNAWLVNAVPALNNDDPPSLLFVRPSGGVTFPLPHYISVIQFDVSDIDPADFSEVRLAFVLLGKIQTGDANIIIRRSLRQWVIPDEITWNEWKDGESWTVAGAQGSDTDFDLASEIAWNTVFPSPVIGNTWLTPDLSVLITAARADDDILRLIFFPDDPAGLWTVGSINSEFVDNQPRLITYL